MQQPPHRGDEWVVFDMRDGSQRAMWITDEMAMRSVRLEANVAPVASVDPASSSYALICGAIPVEICTAAAAGAVVGNETPAAVQVTPGAVSPYRVTFTYPDGSGTSVDVERDPTWEIGWSPLQSAPAPVPTRQAGDQLQPRGPLTPNAAAALVMRALSDEPQLAGLSTTSTPSALEVTVSLTHNDDRVPDVWLAGLAVGAIAELAHSEQTAAGNLISSATAIGPGKGGGLVTTHLGVGAVRLGQVFGSPSDSALTAHIADVAMRFGLKVADLRILHPLESALRVAFVVPNDVTIDWTIDQLRTALVGQPPDVEAVLIELDDPNGQPLLQSGVAYRTGEGGLWFAPGQDDRFGAVHSHPPRSRPREARPRPMSVEQSMAITSKCCTARRPSQGS